MYRFRFNAGVLSWLNDCAVLWSKGINTWIFETQISLYHPLTNLQPIVTLRPILPCRFYPVINQSFGVCTNAAGQMQGCTH